MKVDGKTLFVLNKAILIPKGEIVFVDNHSMIRKLPLVDAVNRITEFSGFSGEIVDINHLLTKTFCPPDTLVRNIRKTSHKIILYYYNKYRTSEDFQINSLVITPKGEFRKIVSIEPIGGSLEAHNMNGSSDFYKKNELNLLSI